MIFDLLAEMEQDGFSASRKSNSRSGQHNGACILPNCNGLGDDRLRVQPNYGTSGWFACNVCGTKGTGIDYLVIKRGWSKQEALKYVGWKPKDGSEPKFIIPRHILTGEVNPTHEAPCEAWQTSAKAFVKYCMDILWSEQGQEALDYLHSRGLKDETIRTAQLGYNPAEMRRPGARWGRKGKMVLKQGIVIPWFVGEDLWRITIRDEKMTEGSNRYKQVAGGSNGLYLGYLLGYDRPVILVEGEFDALSIAQEAGHDVSVVATGSTEGSHTVRWLTALAMKDMVLVAFDAEEKGDRAADWWLKRLENAHRLRPWWEDANQMLQDGIDLLNDWIVPRIESIVYGSSSPFSRLAIPDGCVQCHMCHCIFPSFEGWEPESIPMDAPSPSYDPTDGQPYCKQCRPELFIDESTAVDQGQGRMRDYEQFQGDVQAIADAWPGGNCTVTFHPRGYTLKQYVAEEMLVPREPYSPVSLPSLPRSVCPCVTLGWTTKGEQTKQRCNSRVQVNGFCAEHRLSYDLLGIGAQLGYPEVQIPFRWKGETLYRTIPAGVTSWEQRASILHAERPRALEENIEYLRRKFALQLGEMAATA